MTQPSPHGAHQHERGSDPRWPVTLVNNPDAFEFYLDAVPGYTSADIAEAFAHAEKQGLQALDPDEADPEFLDDGTVRIWLTTTDCYTGPGNPMLF
jgi:hypothetical protein